MIDTLKRPYVVPGLIAFGVGIWALATVGGAIVSGHPAYWVLYGGTVLLGLAAVVAGFALRGRKVSVWLSIPATIGLLVLAVVGWRITPYEATDRAVSALTSDEVVLVESSPFEIIMEPSVGAPEIGVIFQPGGRVDARAYARILRPVAEAGYRVVIVKQPLGFAFLAAGFAPGWAADHPEVDKWVVAGHSLGGVVAARNAADSNGLDDLVLWASFPGSDLSDEVFDAVSIFGTNDGLATTDEIEASIQELPDGTNFVAIEGAIHSHFGDYGLQPGDGEPGISREEAQDLIIRATLAFLIR